MTSSRLLIPLVISSLILAGCGNAAAPVASTTPAPATPVVAAIPGCPAVSSISAKTSDLKETTFAPVTSFILITKAKPDSARLLFSNYDVSPDNIYAKSSDEYTTTDALISVYFKDSVTKIVGAGNYSGADDAKMKVTEVDISSKKLSGGVFDKKGALEITHVDHNVACGTLNFDDGYSFLKGSFIAKVKAS